MTANVQNGEGRQTAQRPVQKPSRSRVGLEAEPVRVKRMQSVGRHMSRDYCLTCGQKIRQCYCDGAGG